MALISVAELRSRLYQSQLSNDALEQDADAELALGAASDRITRHLQRNMLAARHTYAFMPLQGEYDYLRQKSVVQVSEWPIHRVSAVDKANDNARLIDGLDVEPFAERSGDEAKRYVILSDKQYDPVLITFYAGYRLSDETDNAVNTRLGLIVDNASITINWASVASGIFIEHVVAGTVGNGYTVTFEYDGSITNGEAVAEYGDNEITIKCRGVVTYGEAIDAINAARLNDVQIVEASISSTGSANRATSKNWTSADSAVTGMLSGGEGDAANGPITWPVLPPAITEAVVKLVAYEVQRMSSGAIGRRDLTSQLIQGTSVGAQYSSDRSFERDVFRSIHAYRKMLSHYD